MYKRAKSLGIEGSLIISNNKMTDELENELIDIESPSYF